MQLRVKKRKTIKLNKKQKERKKAANLRWIVKKYNTGDLDLNKTSHYIQAKIAVSKGMLPKEVMEHGRKEE